MPLDFPTSPSLNQVYINGGSSWIWNGSGWVSYNPSTENVVDSLNGFTGTVTLAAGDGLTLFASTGNIEISSILPNFYEGLTSPSNPVVGDRWYNTEDGIIYTSITQGMTQGWVVG